MLVYAPHPPCTLKLREPKAWQQELLRWDILRIPGFDFVLVIYAYSLFGTFIIFPKIKWKS